MGVLLAALTISALGELMITANEGVQSFCNEMVGSSMADSVVNDNLFDLRYIDSTYGIATFQMMQKPWQRIMRHWKILYGCNRH